MNYCMFAAGIAVALVIIIVLEGIERKRGEADG